MKGRAGEVLIQRCSIGTSAGSIGRNLTFPPVSQVGAALPGEILRMIGAWIGGSVAAFMLASASAAAAAIPVAQMSTPVTQTSTDVRAINELIDRNHRSIGGLPGYVATWRGVITQANADIQYTTVAQRDGRYRTVYELPLGERSEGNDGASAWIQDLNGNVVTEPAIRHRTFLTRLLGYNAALYDETLSWTRAGSGQLDGRAVEKLRTSLGTSDALFYIDARTGLVDGVDIGDRSVRYPRYGSFGALTVPTKAVETEKSDTVIATIDDVRFSGATTVNFAPPQPRAPVFPAGQSDISLNFEAPHSLIILNVQLNGTPANFLLDSGSSASLIDIDAAKSLGLPTAGSSHVAAATVLSGTMARVESLSFGGILFRPFVFQAVPLGLPPSIRGYGVKGILGYDVLAQLVARIDYGRDRIRLIAPASFTYNGTGAVVALDASGRLPRVPATLGEKDQATFTIDTGSDAGLIIYQDFAAAHQRDILRPGDLAAEQPGPPLGQIDVTPFFSDLTRASGAGGSIRVKTGYVSRVGLGSFEVMKVFTEIVLEPSGAFAPTVSDGLLGAAVLSKFGAVFLDYQGGRLILER